MAILDSSSGSSPSLATVPPLHSSSSPVESHSIPPFTTVTVQNISGMVPIKLQAGNYLLWKNLFLPILRKFKMLGLITGAEPPPPCTILAADGSTLGNPAFDLWYDKDQNLMIWIISTLSSDLLSHIVGIETSRALWELLEKRFAGVSRATIHQLRSRLQTLTKGDLPMITYLQQMKEIVAGLGAASHPLTDADLVAYILAGLPEEYDSFVTSIETRSEPVSSDELHGFLLGREAAILQRKTRASLSVTHEPFHAYAALLNSSRSSQVFSKNRGPGRSHFPSQFQPRSLHSSNRGLLPTHPVSWMHG